MRLFDFERRVYRHLHWGILGCMVALAALGVIAIAGSELEGGAHAQKQTVWICLGVIAFLRTL